LVPIMMCENIGLSPCSARPVREGQEPIQLGLGGGGNGGRWNSTAYSGA